jgi:hypothetical protein
VRLREGTSATHVRTANGRAAGITGPDRRHREEPMPFARRRPRLVRLVTSWASALSVGLLAAACGSPSTPSARNAPASSKQTSSTTKAPSTPGPKYTSIGTLTVPLTEGTGGGTASLTYSIGKPVVGSTPPAGASTALSACDVQGTTRGSVYIPGKVKVTFGGGPYAEQLELRGGDTVSGPGNNAASANDVQALREAIDVSGTWSCGTGGTLVTGSNGFLVTFQPGQSMTFPLWVFAIFAVNNQTPTFEPSANASWSFAGYTVSTLSGAKSGSGPNAYVCAPTTSTAAVSVSLFASPPFALTFGGQETTCTSPG